MSSRTVALRRAELYVIQNRRCIFCGRFCKWQGSGSDPTLFTIEHIVPKRFGGQNTNDNMIGACYRCNHKRAYEIDVATKAQRRIFRVLRAREKIEISRKWTQKIPPLIKEVG